MAAPTLISDLSTTIGSNGPDGATVSPIEIDNYLRAHAGFIAQLREGTGQANPDRINLKAYGATGDGATNDATAIAAAIAAANAGDTIVGLGTYLISTTTSVSKALTFEGIKFKIGGNVSMLTLDTNDIHFNGCEFDLALATTTSGKALYAQSRSRISVQNCKFTDGYYGCYFESCTYVSINNNYCKDSLHWHIFIDGCADVHVHGNICMDGAYDGIKLASATSGTGVQRSMSNISVTSNICIGNARDGVDCASNSCANLLIANNVLINNKLTGIEVKTVAHADTALTYTMTNLLIENNLIRNGAYSDNGFIGISCQSGDGDYGVRTLGSQYVDDAAIRGNKIYLEEQSTNNAFGIRAADLTKAVIEGNVINCAMAGSSTTGLIRVHFGVNILVRNNSIDATGSPMCGISADSQGGANPTAGVAIVGNRVITGASANPIRINDSAVSGTTIQDNRLYPDSGQYSLVDSGTNTYFGANYRGVTTGAPTARGYPGDYYIETTQTAGYPERWTCTVTGAPATWVGMNQRGFRSNAGSPASSVTPTHAGEMLYDSSGTAWYKASGAANTTWTKLTN